MSRNYNPSLAAQQTKEGKRYLAPIRDMNPYQRLMYWIKERHAIHCKRFGLQPAKSFAEPKFPDGKEPNCWYDPPWSKDPIFQHVFFCNVYRECDRVTGYLRDNFRDEYANDEAGFWGTILLRLFNHIPTMRRLINANIPQAICGGSWDRKGMLKLLIPLRDAGEQMFGGAYIINFHTEGRKVEALATLFDKLVHDKNLYRNIYDNDMAYAESRFTAFHGLGPFYTYQLIGDLAFTQVFPQKRTPDWETWSFSGPGTSRGLDRLRGTDKLLKRQAKRPEGWQEQLNELLVKVNRDLKKLKYPCMHIRDLTNCLCEYDKYCRALGNERSIKRPYNGT